MDGSSAVGLDHELAVAERAHHPVDVGVDDNSLADEVGIRHRAEGHHGILPLPMLGCGPAYRRARVHYRASDSGALQRPKTAPKSLSGAPRPAAEGPASDALQGRAGLPVEAHYIGELAARLGKSSHTIRRWEREGVLPATPFEQRVRRRPARRLYPLHWIEGVVAIAEDEGLVGRKPACMKNTHFTARARELHRRLFG